MSRNSTGLRSTCFRIILLLVGAAVLVSPLSLHAETRRALLVGIDTYLPAPKKAARNRTPDPLDGPVNDVEAISEILKNSYKFQSNNIHILKNREATRERILAETRKQLIEPAAPGDVHVFFFAGHGSQVTNSLSTEPDKKDETIVPADAALGVWAIRDKELRRLFNDVLDKGASLTVFFDSCHSGSIARGLAVTRKSRYLPPDPRDIAKVTGAEPPDPRPAPEERGALIFSAAQDREDAVEDTDEQSDDKSHGAFSLALLKVFRTNTVSLSAEQLFLRAKAVLWNRGYTQEPVLAGPADRRQQSPFGSGSYSLSGYTSVAVLNIKDAQVELEGGYAIGLAAGAELARAGAAADEGPVRLRVDQVTGLSRATARVIAGRAESIHAGDLFVVDAWVEPEGSLAVWMPPATLPSGELIRIAQELSTLRTSDRLQWVDDPTEDTPTHTVTWDGSAWKLSAPDAQGATLGKAPTAKSVLDKLPGAGQGKAKLFVLMPPPADWVPNLKLASAGGDGPVQVATTAAQARYHLVGKVTDQGLEYAWVQPNALRQDTEQHSSLPVRTDWVAVGSGPDVFKNAASRIGDLIERTARTWAWLNLTGPASDGRFPYTLALKNMDTDEIVDTGTVKEGEKFKLVLRADQGALRQAVDKRYVYVFVLDVDGKSHLLFPAPDQGNVENQVPYDSASPEDVWAPTEIPLRSRYDIEIRRPLGTDTYVLLSSRETIPEPRVLDYEGGRTRGKRPETALARLLSSVGTRTRSAGLSEPEAVPVNWSIQRLTLRSVPSTPE